MGKYENILKANIFVFLIVFAFDYVFYLIRAFSCLGKVNGKIVHFDQPNNGRGKQ